MNQADGDELDELAGLFDRYRQYYGQARDLDGAREFVGERLAAQDSRLFVATQEERSVGFTQLYPSFSSVAMRRIWILNDLYVAEHARRQGVARALLDHAREFAANDKAARLVLATLTTNEAAKKLYESLGWQPDTAFDHYALPIA